MREAREARESREEREERGRERSNQICIIPLVTASNIENYVVLSNHSMGEAGEI